MGASDRPQPGTRGPTCAIQPFPCCHHHPPPSQTRFSVLVAMVTWPPDSYDGGQAQAPVEADHLPVTHTPPSGPPAGPDSALTILTNTPSHRLLHPAPKPSPAHTGKRATHIPLRVQQGLGQLCSVRNLSAAGSQRPRGGLGQAPSSAKVKRLLDAGCGHWPSLAFQGREGVSDPTVLGTGTRS